jgi:hypothetical protein
MNDENIHSWSVNVDRRIALALRRDPKLLGVFERRLRSKMATTRSAAAVGDDDWEWYVILTLWSPLQVIKLLEDSSPSFAVSNQKGESEIFLALNTRDLRREKFG